MQDLTNKEIGSFVRSLLDRYGLTHEELASVAGVSRWSIERVLTGRVARERHTVTLSKVLAPFGLSVNDIPKEQP